ncbi:per1-like protein PGAP5 isoform X2 [Oratosquilla oratoria]|uniref:per1-like protein PGAP5 isoform X2 n=1 Tax=Oratosquilla oratoria TaxID=337810 RepID=UPI003F77761A
MPQQENILQRGEAQVVLQPHQHHTLINWSDIFDEGKWSGTQEFAEYKKRFDDLFPVPTDTKVLIAVGNHDIGFHYSATPRMVQQFEKAFATSSVQLTQIRGVTFITINSIAMEGDSCFLCKPAVNKIKLIKRQLDCTQGKEDACQYWKNKDLVQYSQPIILQHYPMYRESDEICNEPDEAPEKEKYLAFREKWDCLSLESTQLIFKELRPRLVLSGHTHHGCHLIHESYNGSLVEEFTVPSFSWRNKESPTFIMLSVTPDKYEAYKCHMPRENTVIFLYIFGFVSVVAYIIRLRIRNQEVCYIHSD